MTKIKKMLVLAVFASAISFSVSACNTMEGLGEDTRVLGDAISGTARDTRGY